MRSTHRCRLSTAGRWNGWSGTWARPTSGSATSSPPASSADIGAAAEAAPGLPKGPDCLPAYRETVDELIVDLAARDPDELDRQLRRRRPPAGSGTVGRPRRWPFTAPTPPTPSTPRAATRPTPLDPALAADGVDEWARFWLAVRWPLRYGAFPDDLVGRSVHIHGTDDPAPPDGAEWHLAFGTDLVEVVAAHQKGDVALRGPAADLLLTLWRRRPLATVDLVGDTAVAERLYDIARF